MTIVRHTPWRSQRRAEVVTRARRHAGRRQPADQIARGMRAPEVQEVTGRRASRLSDECHEVRYVAVRGARRKSRVPRRGGDLAARYGGEEFVILMAETDAAGANTVAERLCMAVRDLRIPHQHGVDGIVTVSVGVAVVQPGPGHAGPAGLVEAADAALYAAKAGGRNRVSLSHGVVQPL